MFMSEEEEVVGLSTSDVSYPLLISLYGKTKKGKTYFGASFPNAVVFDFAPVKWSYRGVSIDTSRTVGEGFRSIFMSQRKDGQIIWVPKIPGFSYKNQYKFIKNKQDMLTAIEHARFYAESIPKENGKVWVVLDDSNRWRGIEVSDWQEKNGGKWPAQQQFGQIVSIMKGELTQIQEFANVLLISQMSKSFETDEYVAQIYPSGSDYLADASIEISEKVKDNKNVQVIKVHSNGHDFICNPGYCTEVEKPDPMEVLLSLKIPRELW